MDGQGRGLLGWAIPACLALACSKPGNELELYAVEPSVAVEGAGVEITITGRFPASVRVSFRRPSEASVNTAYTGRIGGVMLPDLQWRDLATLTASSPASLPVGHFDLEVIAPDGRTRSLPGAFEVRIEQGSDGGPGWDGGGDPSGDPGGDNDSAGGDDRPTTITDLQTGETSITGTDLRVDLPLAAPVDPSSSVLMFNYTYDGLEVSDSLVSGQLASDGGSVIFERIGTGVDVTSLRWTVIEIVGAAVQRGAVDLIADTRLVVPVTLAQPVDPGRSFVIHSSRKAGTNYDWDEFVRATLRDASTLELSRGTCCLDAVEWQVVELPPASGVRVAHGEESMPAGQTEKTVALASAMPMTKSFLLISYAVLADNVFVPPAVANHLVSGRLSSNTDITLTRDRADLPLDISWTVVSWGGLTVQHGQATLASSEASSRVDLPIRFPLDRSVSLLPALMRGGRTAYSAGDAFGLVWFGTHLEDAQTLVLERGTTADAAVANWTVIAFD